MQKSSKNICGFHPTGKPMGFSPQIYIDSFLAQFIKKCLLNYEPGYLLLNYLLTDHLLYLVKLLLTEYYSIKPFHMEICAGYIEHLLFFIMRESANFPVNHDNKTPMSSSDFLAVIQYIYEHYKELTLPELADVFHYSPNHLGKLIKDNTGETYIKIVTKLKIDCAKNLLESTNDSIEDIAAQSGFKELIHFSRRFKQETGFTPSAYRKQFRQ